jgi:hypothetical protein
MTTATITKTLQKVADQPSEYTLGFRRWSSLPRRVCGNVITACVLKGETSTQPAIKFLNDLTDSEFTNWLKSA